MKKIILSVCLFSLFAMNIQAQATDFTVTDLDGNEHSLYADYLDQGKAVIIDFSATWCGPCWTAHNSGVMEEVYHAFGPEGSNDIAILMLEIDGGTTLADLQGPTANSWGDWITGTPYPIADLDEAQGNSVSSAYGVSGIPQITLVCPDGSIGVQTLWGNQWSFDYVTNSAFDCIPASANANDVKMMAYRGGEDGCYGTETSVLIRNNGQDEITTLNFGVYRDEYLVASIPWTGNLGSAMMSVVDLGSVEILDEQHDLAIRLLTEDDDATNNETLVTLHRAPVSATEVTLYMETDQWTADETSCSIYDENGTVIYEAAVGDLPNSGTVTETFTLDADLCYTLELNDSYGDGVAGVVTLTDSDGLVLFENASFGSGTTSDLHTGAFPVSTDDHSTVASFDVVPNPVYGEGTVRINLINSTKAQLDVINALGQVVLKEDLGTLNQGEYTQSIDMNRFQAGVYFVNLRTETGVSTHRIVKQ